jgi:hypothetical protein
MKQKSQSTEAVHTSGQRSLMQFGQVPPNAWKISGKTLTLDEFIDNHRQEIVSADLQVLRTFTDRLLDKLKGVSSGNGNLRTLRGAVSSWKRVRCHVMRNAGPPSQSSWSSKTGFAVKRAVIEFWSVFFQSNDPWKA